MSFVSGRDATHPTQTPKKTDYSTLYEAIGNIVIERAHVGNKECEDIYAHAWRKTREPLN